MEEVKLERITKDDDTGAEAIFTVRGHRVTAVFPPLPVLDPYLQVRDILLKSCYRE